MLYPRYANDLLFFTPTRAVTCAINVPCKLDPPTRFSLCLTRHVQANVSITVSSKLSPRNCLHDWHEHPRGSWVPIALQQPAAVYKLVNHITPRTSASTQSIAPICILKVLGRTQHRRRQWGRTLLMPAPRNPPCPARELLPPTGDPCPICHSAKSLQCGRGHHASLAVAA